MLAEYHRQITLSALKDRLSTPAIETVINANLRQDGLVYQVGHSHFHFDNDAFEESYAYIEDQRQKVWTELEEDHPVTAREHFGRLTHAAQDLYAHSNYVDLWLEKHNLENIPLPDLIDPCDELILADSRLRSGRLYYPLEALSFISSIRKFILPLLPRDSHAWMNLDSPASGDRFAYAFSAAVKRTRIELENTLAPLSRGNRELFSGKR